jgi:hypothetical protein
VSILNVVEHPRQQAHHRLPQAKRWHGP